MLWALLLLPLWQFQPFSQMWLAGYRYSNIEELILAVMHVDKSPQSKTVS